MKEKDRLAVAERAGDSVTTAVQIACVWVVSGLELRSLYRSPVGDPLRVGLPALGGKRQRPAIDSLSSH